MSLLRRLIGAALLLAAWPAMASDVTVFAAASLKTALDEIAEGYRQKTGAEVTLALGGSSSLARQIEHGAPADIFISASPDWMDRLEAAGRIEAGTRIDLLGNRLVLIAHGVTGAAENGRAEIGPGFDLPGLLGNGRLAMALVDAVPAGIYGKAALGSLDLWDAVRGQVAQADNVRAALALVASGEAPLGIVYATDATAEPRVGVVGLFPEDTHPPILYPAAAVAGRGARAEPFLAYLRDAGAAAVFTRHGFRVIGN